MGAAYDAGDSYVFPELNDEIAGPDGTTATRGKLLMRNSLVLSRDPNKDDRFTLPTLGVTGVPAAASPNWLMAST
jgi:hypothetical protein